MLTYAVYTNSQRYLLDVGENFARQTFATTRLAIVDFVGGGLVLFISACVFVPTYLLLASLWGVIEPAEKDSVRSTFKKILFRRSIEPLADTHA